MLGRGSRLLIAVCALPWAWGCAETTKPPFRARPKLDAGEQQPREDAGQDGEAGSIAPPTPMRPTGVQLTEMIEALRALGADVDDPDRLCAGWSHVCGIDAEGRVHCFAGGEDARTMVPMLETKAKQVACGINFSCLLDEEGTIACWGAGSDPTLLDLGNLSQSIPPEGVFTQIAIGAGGSHACAIAENGSVECWGAGSFDKPSTAPANFRQAIPPMGTFVRLAAGEAHTCGIRDTGEIACWGGGGGECFPPTSYGCGQTTPPEGSDFTDLTAGEFHTCGLRDDGSATCWGMGLSASPCAPDSGGVDFDCGQGLIPEHIQTRIKRIRAGNLHTCAITDEYEAVCWGWNASKEAEPPILYAFSQVVGGERFSCGWTTGSVVECWGAAPSDVPEELAFPPRK